MLRLGVLKLRWQVCINLCQAGSLLHISIGQGTCLRSPTYVHS